MIDTVFVLWSGSTNVMYFHFAVYSAFNVLFNYAVLTKKVLPDIDWSGKTVNGDLLSSLKEFYYDLEVS
jgi:hypothetical protein